MPKRSWIYFFICGSMEPAFSRRITVRSQNVFWKGSIKQPKRSEYERFCPQHYSNPHIYLPFRLLSLEEKANRKLTLPFAPSSPVRFLLLLVVQIALTILSMALAPQINGNLLLLHKLIQPFPPLNILPLKALPRNLLCLVEKWYPKNLPKLESLDFWHKAFHLQTPPVLTSSNFCVSSVHSSQARYTHPNAGLADLSPDQLLSAIAGQHPDLRDTWADGGWQLCAIDATGGHSRYLLACFPRGPGVAVWRFPPHPRY